MNIKGALLTHLLTYVLTYLPATFCLPRRLEDVFKTSWKAENCYAKDVFTASSKHLHQDECFLRRHQFFEKQFFPSETIEKHHSNFEANHKS